MTQKTTAKAHDSKAVKHILYRRKSHTSINFYSWVSVNQLLNNPGALITTNQPDMNLQSIRKTVLGKRSTQELNRALNLSL